MLTIIIFISITDNMDYLLVSFGQPFTSGLLYMTKHSTMQMRASITSIPDENQLSPSHDSRAYLSIRWWIGMAYLRDSSGPLTAIVLFVRLSPLFLLLIQNER